MLANALLAATLVMVAILFGLMDVCAYLRPHRWALVHVYGTVIGASAAVALRQPDGALLPRQPAVLLEGHGPKAGPRREATAQPLDDRAGTLRPTGGVR